MTIEATTAETALKIILGENNKIKCASQSPFEKVGKLVHYIEFHGTTTTMRIEQDIRDLSVNVTRDTLGLEPIATE